MLLIFSVTFLLSVSGRTQTNEHLTSFWLSLDTNLAAWFGPYGIISQNWPLHQPESHQSSLKTITGINPGNVIGLWCEDSAVSEMIFQMATIFSLLVIRRSIWPMCAQTMNTQYSMAIIHAKSQWLLSMQKVQIIKKGQHELCAYEEEFPCRWWSGS